MWTRAYLADLAERVVGSSSAAALATLGGDVVNVWSLDWHQIGGVALGAGLLSLLKGLAARKVGDTETGSVTDKRATT